MQTLSGNARPYLSLLQVSGCYGINRKERCGPTRRYLLVNKLKAVVMGCGAGRLRRNVVAPSRHGNVNQAEEDNWRSQDKQALDFTDGVDKVTTCDEVSKQDCDIQSTNGKQVNKQEELCASSAEESVVNKQQGDQLQEINSKQHTGNKQENTKVKVQDGRVVNKQIQQEINNELDAPEDNKQQPINKQKDISIEVAQDSVVSKQSDKETSEDSEDEEILKQPALIEWASASQGVNKQQIVAPRNSS